MQWRKSLWWWGVRPAAFAPGWGDTSVAAAPEFADAPMRVARPAGAQSSVSAQALQALKAFVHDQVCDVETLRAQRQPALPTLSRTVRYQHPVSGLTWDGQGRQPQWLRDALLHEGWLLIDLRQAAQAQASH